MQAFTQYLAVITIALIIIEALLSAGHELHEHKKKDMISSISIGIFCIMVNLFFKGCIFLVLVKLQSIAAFHLRNQWWVWILLFALSDISHYGFHYIEHRCRFFWAAHVMHHSSKYYNLSVGLRTPLASNFYRLIVQAPLCLAGFQPAMIITMESLILIYAFLLHTEHIKKLGYFEIIFNTPSHHRVHHGSNEQYIDKNFGTVLIIWDKLFGTFQPEEEKPVYGITSSSSDTNPIAVVSHEWKAIAKDVSRSHNWKEAIYYIVSRPGWKPAADAKKRIKVDNLRTSFPYGKYKQGPVVQAIENFVL